MDKKKIVLDRMQSMMGFDTQLQHINHIYLNSKERIGLFLYLFSVSLMQLFSTSKENTSVFTHSENNVVKMYSAERQ